MEVGSMDVREGRGAEPRLRSCAPLADKEWRSYADSSNWHEAASPVPVMSEQEIDDLADDIREHGLAHPIVLFQSKVLDGRNRIRACVKADVEPKFVEATMDDPARLVWQENMQRFHMTPDQRAMVV